MALTGKTIGELGLLQFPTNDTLLPVEYIGDTYHIPFSSITYTEGTYSQFVSDAGNGVLTPGRYYLMTDHQSCYDQPNYDNTRTAITTGNYMTGNTEPLLLMAVSTTNFSPTVYSTDYPKDKIKYDITWDTTEITNSPAKGRITERIDQYNNRTDYDHRNILFKRYRGYSYNENSPLTGLVGISGITGNTATLYGNTGTTFNSSLSVGSLIAVKNLNPYLFEIVSIGSDSSATISGVTISTTTNSSYYIANDDGIMSYYQPNVRREQIYQYTTFGDALDEEGAVNNYIGDYSNLHIYEGVGDFLLANNVFLVGAFINNTIGNRSYNNTFNDDCDNNQIGDSFYNNLINDDFDGNIIGENFRNNYITANFNNNRIGSDFNNNILIGSDFNYNNIGYNFNDNTINSGNFYRNNIGNDFNGNIINDWFQNNEIGNQFQNNEVYGEFYKNDIGNGYNNNNIYGDFYGNLIGNGYNVNTVYSHFRNNIVGEYFYNNTFGSVTNIGNIDFYENRIGNRFEDNIIRNNFNDNDILNGFDNNTIDYTFGRNKILNNFYQNTIGSTGNTSYSFEHNQIMHEFDANNIQGSFLSNNIKKEFKGNEILGDFDYNNIGSNFAINNISGTTIYNNIGDYFRYNNCYGDFMYNTIGVHFQYNEVDDGFGVGYGDPQGNRIGNNVFENNIGEYFYNNTIPDNFHNNNIGDYFQRNIVDTNIDNIDFTTNYGNVTGFTYIASGTGSTNNTYTALTSQTNGKGVSATFDVVVLGGSVTNVTLNASGKLYLTGNTVTILGTSIGGTDVTDDIVITVSGVSQKPSVYEPYTCNIFKNSGLTNRLSYYDETDTLIIDNINE